MMKLPQTIAVTTLALLCISACSSMQPARERIQVNVRGPRIIAGSAEAQVDPFLSVGLQLQPITVIYFPDDDVICLQFRTSGTTYFQFWSERNRTAFLEALARYHEDFEQRNLTSGRQNKRIYGTVRGFVSWETHQFSPNSFSHPVIELGYYFKNNHPYFALTQREAPNESETTKRGQPRSVNQVLYFTRGQADDIAAIFSPDYLQQLRLGVPASALDEPDVYEEEG